MSGRPQAVMQTEKAEIEQGDQAAKDVETQIGLVGDAALNAYVRSIGARLAAHSERADLTYTFHVVEMQEPNAFALPGGHIYVSRGLLVLLNSEAELANVLGHELGHVAARHSVGRQTANVPLIPIRVVTGLAGSVTSIVAPRVGNVVTGLGQAPGTLVLAKYGRDQEREADRLGQGYAAAAGWDPKALGTFMQTLGRDAALQGDGSGRTSLLATHPSSPERSKAAASHAAELVVAAGQPAPLDRAAFLSHLVGLPIGDDAAGGVFVGTKFLQPELGFAFSVPSEWETANGRAAVTATEPDQQSQVALTVSAKGDDPMPIALAFAKENPSTTTPQPALINGLPAARASLEQGRRADRVRAEIAWIAHGGLIYRLSGSATAARFSRTAPQLERSIQSFHALSQQERAEVSDDRLRVVRAHAGERIDQLSERTMNVWPLDALAVANAVEVDTVLTGTQLLKIAYREAYTARSPAPTETTAEPQPASP